MPPRHDDKQQSFWLAETLKVRESEGGRRAASVFFFFHRSIISPPTPHPPSVPQYFYLLFSPDDALPLTGDGGWVLNTEAHPLRRLPSSAVTALTVDFVAPPKPAAAAAAVVAAAGGAGTAASRTA
jgi:hypothetical protein